MKARNRNNLNLCLTLTTEGKKTSNYTKRIFLLSDNHSMYLAFRGDLHLSESLSSPFMACLHFFTWQCGKVLSALFMWKEKRNGNVVYWWSIDSQEGENQHKKPKKAPKESSLIQDYHVYQLYYLNFTRIDMLTFCAERSINAIEGKKKSWLSF